MAENIKTKELMMKLLSEAKKDKKGLIRLKNTAVTCQQYELASILREMESEEFPIDENIKKEREVGDTVSKLFKMANLNLSPELAWTLYQIAILYKDGSEDFFSDIDKIEKERVRIFFNEEE